MGNKINILVTGATGFIGQHLCRSLLDKNYRVYGLTHSLAERKNIGLCRHVNFSLVEGDIRYPDSLQKVLSRFSFYAVLHLASVIPGTDEDAKCFSANIAGTYNLLNLCQKHDVRHLIYSSSQEVYGAPHYLPVDESHPRKPENFYGYSKLEGEDLCEYFARKLEMKIVILRYAGVFGPGKKKGAVYNFFRSAFRDEQPVIENSGNQTKDFVYVPDIVDCTIRSLTKINEASFEVYNAGSGQETGVYELAREIYRLVGKELKIEPPAEKSGERFYLDIARASKDLQYKPTPIHEALNEMSIALKKEFGTNL